MNKKTLKKESIQLDLELKKARVHGCGAKTWQQDRAEPTSHSHAANRESTQGKTAKPMTRDTAPATRPHLFPPKQVHELRIKYSNMSGGAVLIQITQRGFLGEVSLLLVTSFSRQPFAQLQKDELFPDYYLAILPGSHLACLREDGIGPFEAYIEFIQIVSFSYWLQKLFVVLIDIWGKCKTFLVIENQLKLW